MKRTMLSVLALAVVLAAAAPALAGNDQEGGTAKVQGWITCECCTKTNANAGGKECTIGCNKSGKALVLVSGDKVYKLSDQKAALAHVGHEVVVTGAVAKDGSLTVSSIEAKKS